LDAATWSALAAGATESVITTYSIAPEDVAGPFEKSTSGDLVAMAALPALSYGSPAEELAEKFHMSGALLRKLNPRADLTRAGEQIAVAHVSPLPLRSNGRGVAAQPPKEGEPQGPRA